MEFRMKKAYRSSLTTRFIVWFGAIMLLANIILGVLLLRQSSSMMQSLQRNSMLNISNTAAQLMDGDVIRAMTAEDVGSESYIGILKELSAFQDNVDIAFIYAVRQVGEEEYIFILDPDPVDPAVFGEEILVTEALRQAGRGIAAVDDRPAEDRWGSFCSSFSPVFDSEGNVAGIIGVDFNTDWYQQQAWKNTAFVVMISVLFTLVSLGTFFLIGRHIHKNLEELNAELAKLSGDVEALTEGLLADPGYKAAAEGETVRAKTSAEEETEGSELKILGKKLRDMHGEMERYLDCMHAQINTDGLTRVGNTTAYLERQKELEAKILYGSAAFDAVVFDIDVLKLINDRYGHACGDRVIRAAASIIAACFGTENTYRIGGDEFIAIVERNEASAPLAEQLESIDRAVVAFNQENAAYEAKLSLSRGAASFVPGSDHAFRDVFLRADKQMYARKGDYHRRSMSPA